MAYGRMLKEVAPDEFPETEEELDAKSEAKLNGPDRQAFLAWNRTVFPEFKDTPDDELHALVAGELAHGRKAATTSPEIPSDVLRRNKVVSQNQDIEKSLDTIGKRRGEVMQSGQMTPARESHYDAMRRNIAMPSSLQFPDPQHGESANISSTNIARHETLRRWNNPDPNNLGVVQFMEKMRAEGYDPEVVQPDGFGVNKAVIDKTSHAILAVIDPMATVDRDVVKGGTLADQFIFGPASRVNEAAGNALGAAADFAAHRPLKWRPAYGVREAAGDYGRKLAEEDPDAGVGVAKGLSVAGSLPSRVSAAMPAAQEGGLSFPGLSAGPLEGDFGAPQRVTAQEAKNAQYLKEQERADVAGQSQRDEYFRRYLDEASPDVRRDVASMAGDTLGTTVGEGVSMVTPADITPVGKAVRMASKLGPVARGLDRLRMGAVEIVPEFAKNAVSRLPAAHEASGLPAGPGLASDREAIQHAGAVRTNAADVAAAQHVETLWADKRAAMAKHGISRASSTTPAPGRVRCLRSCRTSLTWRCRPTWRSSSRSTRREPAASARTRIPSGWPGRTASTRMPRPSAFPGIRSPTT